MASSISNINTALVDQRVVEALKSILPLFSAFSYQIELDDCVASDVVRVPLAVDPTVATKTPGTFLTSTGSLTGVDVTVSSFRGAAWDAVEGTMRPSLLPGYWADKAAGAVYGVAKDVIDTALALVTAANFGNTAADKMVVAPADFGQADAAEAWKLATKKIKRQGKTMLLNTDYASALFGGSQLALIYAQAGENFIKSGMLPQFLGLNQMHYNDMPANSESLGGAVIGRAALAVALAKPSMLMASGDGNIVDRRIITEPDSGLSALYTMKADAGGAISGEVCLQFGVAKGQDSVVRIVSA